MRQTEKFDFPAIKRGDTFEEMVIELTDITEDGEQPLAIKSFSLQAKIFPDSRVEHEFQGEVFEGNKIRLNSFQVELAPRNYVYDLEVTEMDGTVFTWIEGKFPVKQDISNGSKS